MKWSFNPCGRYRRDICLLACGVLPELEKLPVEKHLAACAECRKFFAEINGVTAPLAHWEADYAHLAPTQAVLNQWAMAVERAEGRRSRHAARATHITRVGHLFEWCRDMVWPSWRIWAGLAAVWLLILGGNLSLHEPSRTVAMKPAQSQEMFTTLRDRQNILAELLADHFEPREADRKKLFFPKPRTERARAFTI